jgi:small subunit ribosomal protein S6
MERQESLNEDVLRILTLRVEELEEGPSAQLRKRDDDGERGERGDRGDRGDRRPPRGDRPDRGDRPERRPRRDEGVRPEGEAI